MRKCLASKNEEVKANQSQSHPVRTMAGNASIEHHNKTVQIKDIYVKLDEALREKDFQEPLFFDEENHLDPPFESSLQRFRYFENLHDLIRLCAGGGQITSVVVLLSLLVY